MSKKLVSTETLTINKSPRKMFELVYKRLNHTSAYRLKDLHQHTSDIKTFDVLTNFEYKVYNVLKIIRIINREPKTKTTMPEARLYTDF